MPTTDLRTGDLAGRRVLIVGTGREGNAVADAVLPIAASVSAIDDADGDSALAWRARWGSRVPLAAGPEANLDPADFDVAVVSPGVSKHHPRLRALRDAGLSITSGSALWMAEHAGCTTGVTGSKGKSTTASLIHLLSVASGSDAALGGNIGIPLLTLPAAQRYVVELSSYQCSSLTASPDIAVLTALFPEHLDWHGGQEEYYADKLNLVAHGPRVVVANATDPRLMSRLASSYPALEVEPVGTPDSFHLVSVGAVPWLAFRERLLVERSVLPLLGGHNALNACLALAAVAAAGYPVADDPVALSAALSSFRPLEHRLEPIADRSGLVFVNDSLSTSPYATIEALKAFDGRAVTLIVGGQDRGVDYEPLAEHLSEHPVVAVIGLPPSGERILSVIGAAAERVPAADMTDAVAAARRLTPPGGTVLLSPGAPSYGVYRDHADRARAFREAIEQTL
ncbi:MAG: UDP-N-acetylmuramoyl-L-alanine--D-glutamate ligase [Microbacteriaceae bacterium]